MKPHRFTVTDYYPLAEVGILQPDARVELLDGRIIDQAPISPFHGSVSMIMSELLFSTASDRWIVAVHDPLHLDDYSEPKPDVMLLKKVQIIAASAIRSRRIFPY